MTMLTVVGSVEETAWGAGTVWAPEDEVTVEVEDEMFAIRVWIDLRIRRVASSKS